MVSLLVSPNAPCEGHQTASSSRARTHHDGTMCKIRCVQGFPRAAPDAIALQRSACLNDGSHWRCSGFGQGLCLRSKVALCAVRGTSGKKQGCTVRCARHEWQERARAGGPSGAEEVCTFVRWHRIRIVTSMHPLNCGCSGIVVLFYEVV